MNSPAFKDTNRERERIRQKEINKMRRSFLTNEFRDRVMIPIPLSHATSNFLTLNHFQEKLHKLWGVWGTNHFQDLSIKS